MTNYDHIIKSNIAAKTQKIQEFQQKVKTPEDALLIILDSVPDFPKKEEIMTGLQFQPKISDFRRYQLPKEARLMYENELFWIFRFKKHDWIMAKDEIDESILADESTGTTS